MSQKSYVAGVIDKLEAMEYLISEDIPEEIANTFLTHTLVAEPRPPWATGALRRSGVVYIGGTKYMDTNDVAFQEGMPELIGINPRFHGEIGYGKFDGEYSTPKKLKLSKVKYKGSRSTGAISTLRGKITVMYQAPHAAIMHEWPGKFSDPQSGAHYISSKIFMSLESSAFRIKELSFQRLGTRSRK